MSSQLASHLVETLNCKSVTYCHWKSNFSLAQAMSGETDLDLLVDRPCLPQAQATLLELGYKPAVVTWGPRMPNVAHYYGFDSQMGRFVHIHLFSSVLTGESLVKGHLFPFDKLLLENVDSIGEVRVPAKQAELIVFTLRTFIKYGSLLDVIGLSRRPESVETELHWLQADSDIFETLCLLKKYCPVMDEQLFVKCVDTLNGHSSLVQRMSLAWRVRQRLRIYTKYTDFQRVAAYAQVLGGQVRQRLNGNQKNKTLRAGGAVIAFVGPEATGKSSLVAECGRWLGDIFAVKMIHAGKPPSTILTLPVKVTLPLIRRLWPRLRTNRLEGHSFSASSTQSQLKVEGLSSLAYALRSVSLAWDRRKLLVRARRLAANGAIVICDRYPSETLGAMDSRRLLEKPDKKGMIAAIYNWLARLETRLYQQIPPPDIVLRLKVSVETAKKRNRERIKVDKETDAYLESRHRQSQDWHMSATRYIFDIDTERSLAETILSVKKTIWEVL